MFSLTNINDKIYKKITSYSNLEETSKLTSWIRVFSGADNGLILESNTDYNLLRATGQTTSTIYGDAISSGTIGKDFQGKDINTVLLPFTPGIVATSATSSPIYADPKVLRPSPIITGFSSKEGIDQISREGTLQIKAFSKAQMEEIQKYFLEPGYTLFVEMGWNTPLGIKGITKTIDKGKQLSTSEIVQNISQKSLNIDSLRSTRLLSEGEYDCFLGFIVGGNVTSDGDNFNISVSLRGQPSIPSSLQSYRGAQTLNSSGNLSGDTNPDKSKNTYTPEQLTDNESSPEKRRFRYMFNELPANKQLDSVKALENLISINQFINFDKSVESKIVDYSNKNSGWLGIWGEKVVEVTVGNKTIDVEKENLIPKNKYIRMDLAIRIINTVSSDVKFTSGGKTLPLQINIDTTKIGTFPNMFSTNPDKLLIGGTVPDFHSAYFLKSSIITQKKDGYLEGFSPINPDDKITSGKSLSNSSVDYLEDAGYWGWLRYLYVNFDVFYKVLDKKILNTRDVILDLLNEISSAVNAHWKFQIVERKYQKPLSGIEFSSVTQTPDEGDTYLTIVDENFIGKPTGIGNTKIFDHSGINSVFRNANLDIEIPSAMAGLLISSRLGQTVAPDAQIIKTNSTFFNSSSDLFSAIVAKNTGNVTAENGGNDNEGTTERNPSKIQEDIDNKFIVDKTFPKNGGLEVKVIDVQSGKTVWNYGVTPNGAQFSKVYDNVVQNEYKKLNDELNTAKETEQSQGESRLQTNIDKVDVITKLDTIVSNKSGNAEENSIDNLNDDKYINEFKKNFAIYCYRDSEFFDLMKQNYIRSKTESLSILLPIKYSFTILGNSGIRRGDMFKISGIPDKYSKHGIFQVTEIENQLNQSSWETTITGLYRQIQ